MSRYLAFVECMHDLYVCRTCVFVMLSRVDECVLCCDGCQGKRLPGAFDARKKSRRVSSTPGYETVMPGEAWKDALTDYDVLTWLFQVYTALREHPTLSFSIRQLIVQFASISCDAFADQVGTHLPPHPLDACRSHLQLASAAF